MTKTLDYPTDFPQKDKTRGKRYYQKLKNKLRAIQQTKYYVSHYYDSEEWARKHADHMAACSCWMCGNPRKFFKGKERLTVQELREQERTRSLMDKTESSEDSD